jgi:hypothetical protein
MSAGTGTDPRDRFLRAIVDQIPVDRIAEIHLFPALRSGGRESAVAVVAARADEGFVQGELPPPVGESAMMPVEEYENAPPGDGGAGLEPRSDHSEPIAGGGPPPEIHDGTAIGQGSHHSDFAHIDPPPDERAPRLVVYRAVYRWTRKGPDRGQWEVEITAEADAPLYAVGDVVRGVQRRAGEDGEPELITPEALRLALSDRPWATGM